MGRNKNHQTVREAPEVKPSFEDPTSHVPQKRSNEQLIQWTTFVGADPAELRLLAIHDTTMVLKTVPGCDSLELSYTLLRLVDETPSRGKPCPKAKRRKRGREESVWGPSRGVL